jgi:NitT/TauT family transport system substrate-binding protein
MYPELASRGASEEDAVKTLLYPIKRRMAHFEPPYQDTKTSFIHADELGREAKFLGLNINSVDEIVRTDLVERINDYELDEVKQHAASYNGWLGRQAMRRFIR